MYLVGETSQPPHPNINYMRRQLLIQIHRGKAFTSHLLDQPPLPGHSNATYTLHLSFRGQRFRSRPANCTDEPDIRESFLLELHHNDQKGLYSLVRCFVFISIIFKIEITSTIPSTYTIKVSTRFLSEVLRYTNQM